MIAKVLLYKYIYIISWNLAESARLVEHEKHGNLFCGKCDGEQRKRPLPVLVFVRALKGEGCEKGNIEKKGKFLEWQNKFWNFE